MYLTKLITKLHEMRGIARQDLITAKEKSKEYYDRKIIPQNFKIGEIADHNGTKTCQSH